MKTSQLTLLIIGLAASMPFPLPAAAHDDHAAVVVLRDDCDPSDPGWAPTGGCVRKEGDVNFAEFRAELSSPLSASVIGHQAWRIDPPYVKAEPDDSLMVRNSGGRVHTFTEVRNFGGGKIPVLNKGLATASECLVSTDIAPGGKAQVGTLAEGNHHFQCCIHPWMRAIIKVKRED